jgi:plastocyanin
MKKIYLLTIMMIALQAWASATTHTITTSGFAFTPDSINANVGDTIIFNVAFGTHPLQQVSSGTWAANGTTPLSGGFSASSGSTFSVVMTQADIGVVYYVCTQHVSTFGMKGRIFVTGSNGIANIPSAAVVPYPNPANKQMYFVPASFGFTSYRVTDMLGRTVLEGGDCAQGKETIDVSTLPEGQYILLMTDATGQVSKGKVDVRH